MAAPDTYARTQPLTRAEWRAWLLENHARRPGVWLVYFKKPTGRPRVSYDEAVEEALCFGWVDSLPRKLDAERGQLLFTPRRPRSGWSKINKARIGRLGAAGLLMPAGRAAVEVARQNGAWTSLDAAEAGEVPPELVAALAEKERAQANFNAFTLASRKLILTWYLAAKRPETRAARLAEIVRLAALGKRANVDRPPPAQTV